MEGKARGIGLPAGHINVSAPGAPEIPSGILHQIQGIITRFTDAVRPAPGPSAAKSGPGFGAHFAQGGTKDQTYDNQSLPSGEVHFDIPSSQRQPHVSIGAGCSM
jgi:hypothetical protein